MAEKGAGIVSWKSEGTQTSKTKPDPFFPTDLYRELLVRLGVADPWPGPVLSGSAFRPIERDGVGMVDVWREPIAVGLPLPTLPLWLRGGLCLPVEFEATYERTCVEQRVQPAA
jgi:hypothetical protein